MVNGWKRPPRTPADTRARPAPLQLRQNAALMAACLAFAIILWLYVSGLEPDLTPSVGVPHEIPVAVRLTHSRFAFARVAPPDSPTVTVTVQTTAPLPGHPVVQARVDLANISAPGIYALPVMPLVQTPGDQDAIVTVTPDHVRVFVDRESARDVPVQFRSVKQPPSGFTLGIPVIKPDHLEISGPSTLLNKVAAGIAYDVSNARGPVDSEVSVTLLGVPETVLPWIHYHPDSVSVYLPIIRQQAYATVPVQPIAEGDVADGYRYRMESSPSVVTVSGPASLLRKVWTIATTPVHLVGETASETFRVGLDVPEGLSVQGGVESVSVRVTVAPSSTLPRSASGNPRPLGPGAPLTPAGGPQTVIH